MYQRPIWDQDGYVKFKSWHTLADDLIAFFDTQNMSEVTGIGHSLGAVVSVLAAKKRPDLFKELILIEPVTFPSWLKLVKWIIPISIVKKSFPIAKQALRRRDVFESKLKLFESYRSKKVFARMSDQAILEWIEAGTIPRPDGKLTLRFSKQWEAQIYATVHYYLDDLKHLEIPVSMLMGKETDAIFKSAVNKWKKIRPQDQILEFEDSGHLLPFEKSAEVANFILNKLKK